jgi:hypothetical protein
VPKGGVPDDARKSEAILILGDSVGVRSRGRRARDARGPAARALSPRSGSTTRRSIGYSTPDYRNVVDAFVPAHPEIRARSCCLLPERRERGAVR